MAIPRSVTATHIKGLFVVNPHRFEDNRGLFREAFTISVLEKALGRDFKVKAWNHSRSLPNVVRGLHSEQACKLIYPINGETFVAVADIRPESETFGQHMTFEVSESNQLSIFIDKGLAVGFCAKGNQAVDYQYLMNTEYDELKPTGVLWNDQTLNIQWPLNNPILSDRDRNNPTLKSLYPEKF